MAKAASLWGQAAIAGSTKLAYDSRSFYVRATDTKGHGEKIGGKIPPDVYAQLQALVHSDKFPDYQQPMDVVRDGIIHILETRRNQLDDPAMQASLQTLLDVYRFNEVTEQAERQLQAWELRYARIRETLTKFAHHGAFGDMKSYLDECVEYADPLTEPYRTKVLEMVKEWRKQLPTSNP